jgi:hypothetical protein
MCLYYPTLVNQVWSCQVCLLLPGLSYLTILERAWSANLKMVWYVLLRPLRPELDGQDPFQIIEPCVKLEKRRL